MMPVLATAGTVVSVSLGREEVRLWVQGKDLVWVSDLVSSMALGWWWGAQQARDSPILLRSFLLSG